MSKILITGAAGFIGSQLAHALWQRNHEVVLVDDFSYGQEDNLVFDDHDFRQEVLRADICDQEFMYRLCEAQTFDFIYHIAAVTPLPDCQIDPARAVAVNVAGTVNVLEAARRSMRGETGKVIFASTSAVYENCRTFPCAETDAVPPSLIYSGGKYAAEQFCKSYADVYGMNVTVLRFANVYGPHIDCLRKQPPVAGYMIRELYYDRVPVLHSDGKQERDFIYVEDLIDLAVRVQEGAGFDVVNVSSNETHSINEMFEMIRRIMKKDSIDARYVEASNYWKHYPGLYEGAYVISDQILEHEVNKYTLCDNHHAWERYGWKPRTTFEDGIRATVEFAVQMISGKRLGQ